MKAGGIKVAFDQGALQSSKLCLRLSDNCLKCFTSKSKGDETWKGKKKSWGENNKKSPESKECKRSVLSRSPGLTAGLLRPAAPQAPSNLDTAIRVVEGAGGEH